MCPAHSTASVSPEPHAAEHVAQTVSNVRVGALLAYLSNPHDPAELTGTQSRSEVPHRPLGVTETSAVRSVGRFSIGVRHTVPTGSSAVSL